MWPPSTYPHWEQLHPLTYLTIWVKRFTHCSFRPPCPEEKMINPRGMCLLFLGKARAWRRITRLFQPYHCWRKRRRWWRKDGEDEEKDAPCKDENRKKETWKTSSLASQDSERLLMSNKGSEPKIRPQCDSSGFPRHVCFKFKVISLVKSGFNSISTQTSVPKWTWWWIHSFWSRLSVWTDFKGRPLPQPSKVFILSCHHTKWVEREASCYDSRISCQVPPVPKQFPQIPFRLRP